MKILTLKELQNRAEQYSYKDWQIIVREGFIEGNHLTIVAELDDSIELGKKLTIKVESRIPSMLSIEQFDLWMLERLLVIESHECREWFKLKTTGKAMFYPHVPFSDTDEYMLDRFKEYRGETVDRNETLVPFNLE